MRTSHYSHILEHRPKVSWFEALSENYLGINGASGGRPLQILEFIRRDYPIALHGVSLSIGSSDALNMAYLDQLELLTDRIEPWLVSDHLCWTGVDGENLHDLMPLPYTEAVATYVAGRIERVQERLGRRVLFENVSSYLSYAQSEMQEWEFLALIAEKADCGILLDINNIYVSAFNHGFDPLTYLSAIPAHRVGQFHLAGHSDEGTHLLDTHDHPVCDGVWNLYEHAVRRFGKVSTLLEWDASIPEFAVLEAELAKAAVIEKRAHVAG